MRTINEIIGARCRNKCLKDILENSGYDADSAIAQKYRAEIEDYETKPREPLSDGELELVLDEVTAGMQRWKTAESRVAALQRTAATLQKAYRAGLLENQTLREMLLDALNPTQTMKETFGTQKE